MKCQYYKEFVNKKILIAAPLPKPYGGIAVHAQRLKCELELNGNVVHVYQAHLYSNWFEKCWILLSLIANHHPEVFISHTSYHGLLESIVFIFLRLFWFNHWVIVDHDCRYLDTRSKIFRMVHAKACSLADKVVFMGKTIQELYEKHAIYPKSKSIDSPYIPPSILELIKQDVPPVLDDFSMEYSPVLLINGSCFMKNMQGQDIYGFDAGIELICKLKEKYPKIGLIIMVGKNNDQSYLDLLHRKISLLHIDENILWLIGNYFLPSIVVKASLMIRPTISENFGMSIAEAIDLGIPVVASDCCERYPGTFIYRSTDHTDFLRSVHFVLEKKESSNLLVQ